MTKPTITITLTNCEPHDIDTTTMLSVPSTVPPLTLFEAAEATTKAEAGNLDLLAASLVVDWLTRDAEAKGRATEMSAAELTAAIAQIIWQTRWYADENFEVTAAKVLGLHPGR